MTNAHSLVPSLEEERNPFIYDTCLWNIASGVTTDSAVNVDTQLHRKHYIGIDEREILMAK